MGRVRVSELLLEEGSVGAKLMLAAVCVRVRPSAAAAVVVVVVLCWVSGRTHGEVAAAEAAEEVACWSCRSSLGDGTPPTSWAQPVCMAYLGFRD